MRADFPELLAPAGSRAALEAALESGADAIYLGLSSFNARMNASNFSREELRRGIETAHALGASVYVTLNTLVTQREIYHFTETARTAEAVGADALIIADLGGAAAVHRALPHLPLHASTQMTGHSTDMGRLLASLGYSRMVIARETKREDIRSFCENAPIECEAFLHGALCVSVSGQCLFSSLVGGRSGNRGTCAQPCRLPYRGGYPLSLSDLCLAAEIPELIDMGVASLKIEGRMKSPEYVRDVTKIYRTLLDEGRRATPDELAHLREIFSRGDFTSGYYHGRIDKTMLGVRSESDKETSRALEEFSGLSRKAPISFSLTAKAGEPLSLTIAQEIGGRSLSVTVEGEPPLPAERTASTKETVKKQLSRLGNTPYILSELSVKLDPRLMLPASKLNALRRNAVAAILARTGEMRREMRTEIAGKMRDASAFPPLPKLSLSHPRSARFLTEMQMTEEAETYFSMRYLPLFAFPKARKSRANGVLLPPVVYDSERETVKQALLSVLREQKIVSILLPSLGLLSLVSECLAETESRRMAVIGDFRLNVTNREDLSLLSSLGLSGAILSPELSLAQICDTVQEAPTRPEIIVYGRIPLMLTEKCVNIGYGSGRGPKNENRVCTACRFARHRVEPSYLPLFALTDRRGAIFPIGYEWDHKSVIYNSVRTYMADKMTGLPKSDRAAVHFLFTDESPSEVDLLICSYRDRLPPKTEIRRIK